MRRSHRLLTIAHSYTVSGNRQLAHQIARLGQGRWKVTAVTPDYFHGSQADLRPLRPALTSEDRPLFVELSAYLTSRVHAFVYGTGLRRLLRRDWDLVHCWEEPYIVAGGQLAWWAPPRTPLVFRTAQSLDKHYPFPFNRIERFAMRRAAGWICSGSTVAATLASRPGYNCRPMRLIPLGVDVERFRPCTAAGERMRQQLGWTGSSPLTVGFLGRFVVEKGIGFLTRVLDRLDIPWRALFVGAGPLEGELRAWAKRWPERVRICTDVRHEQVPDHLNAMDLLCAPSQTTPRWREQFGRMLIEGFAAGIPVLGSDSGEIPCVLRDDGVVLPEKDEQAWVQSLTGLFSDPARRRELSQRGLDRAHAEYAWPVIARQHLEFFEELQSARHPQVV